MSFAGVAFNELAIYTPAAGTVEEDTNDNVMLPSGGVLTASASILKASGLAIGSITYTPAAAKVGWTENVVASNPVEKFNAQTHFKLTDDIQFLSTSPGPPGDPVMLNMTVDGDFKSGRSRGARVRRSPG